MGAITDMIQHLGTIVTRRVDSALYNWMLAISLIADNISGATQANVKYVNTAGSDTTGDGSFDNPFLTIQAAVNSIPDANPTTKPYAILVAPGVYPTVFVLKNGVYIVGSGSGAGQFNGTPLLGLTFIAPSAVNAIDASFAGAVVASSGIFNCSLSNAMVVDFAARASTGAGTFILNDIMTESAVTFTGNNVLNAATIRDLYINALSDLTLTNMGGSTIAAFFSDFGGKLNYSQSAAFQSFHDVSGAWVASIAMTWTSALIANSLIVNVVGSASPNGSLFGGAGISITGAGVVFVADQTLTLTMPNAAARLSFGNQTPTDLVGVSCGKTIIECTPTSNRLLTIDRPVNSSRDTTIVLRNLATATFNVDFTFPAGTVVAGSPTYCPPGGEVHITFDFVNGRWLVEPYVQGGSVALTNGVSALVPADISARSAITCSLKTFNGAAGIPAALAAGRVNGTRAGGGGFVITAYALATGAAVGTDQGTYDWHVVNE